MNEIRKTQLKLLEGLKYIDGICRKNSLVYFVHTGTLLGAVREKGFIPWDMDVDLLMPEEDCKKLMDLVREDNNPRYTAVPASQSACLSDRVMINNAYCLYDSGKKSFLHIGICSYAYADPKAAFLKPFYAKMVLLLANVIGIRHQKPDTTFLKKAVIYLADKCCFAFSDNDIRNFIKYLAVSGKKTDFITVYNAFYGFIKETYPAGDFADQKRVPFEDMEVPVPAGYDHVLSRLYGNWHVPPPENKRLSPDSAGMKFVEE